MLVSSRKDRGLLFAVIQMMNFKHSNHAAFGDVYFDPSSKTYLKEMKKDSWSTGSMLSRSTGQDNHTTVVSRFQAISKTLKTNKFLLQVLKHQA